VKKGRAHLCWPTAVIDPANDEKGKRDNAAVKGGEKTVRENQPFFNQHRY